ncbi:AraC family transcriptional regulator [Paenibacillus radicis (ex Gao et al. 2016)]|uniref:HTH-type transcriptional regulator YfiF n=1 Tax=Paenibacillus radicis (ex Gao et al. 2016) TaxID=1737354 RepID=A0A917H9F3_9BACL|nr:AraC family transcriptional regulator [Paenibacillus radicis (ex Gao et al. 2016)]GGG72224.1 putative HTH-type transcriptional regulator YfiF [Paenibacillus radicis (ex Gao et al. 2016)]
MNAHESRDRENWLNIAAESLAGSQLSFQVQYWGINPSHYDNPLHKHSFYEACYVRDGEGIYQDHDTEYPLRKDTLFLSKPGILHQIRSENGLDLSYVAFEIDEANSAPEVVASYRLLLDSSNCIRYGIGETPAALIWRALIGQTRQNDSLSDSLLNSTAQSLLLSLCSAFSEENEEERTLPPRKLSHHSMRSAVLYIRDNLSADLSVKDVARYMHLSVRSLSRLFHENLQVSCQDYIQREKMKRAVHLIRHTDLGFSEIAERAGYGSVHYFTRVFTKIYGVSPGKYRSGQ